MLEAVLALSALATRTVPGIATLCDIDPALGDLPVSARAATPRSDVALVLSRGFAGTNAAVLLRGPSG
jgi:3-oxoacyl-(acyl-carrier-protein) synthase